MTVRLAVESDIPAILEMGRAMVDESPRWRPMPYAAEKVETMCRLSIEQGGAFVAEVSDMAPRCAAEVFTWEREHPGEPLIPLGESRLVGVVLGLLAQHWFSTTWYAGTLAVYVVPAYRGRGTFQALVAHFEEWGAQSGALEWCVGVHTGLDDARMAAAYRHLGYFDAGINLRKPVAVPARAAADLQPRPSDSARSG